MRLSSAQSLLIRHRPEQLARLAGRADDQALPVLVDERVLGMMGTRLKYFRLDSGDQLDTGCLQAQLVLGQNDDVLGEAASLAALRPQLQHLPVDLLQAVDAQLPLHLLEEGDQHIGHHGRVVRWPGGG